MGLTCESESLPARRKESLRDPAISRATSMRHAAAKPQVTSTDRSLRSDGLLTDRPWAVRHLAGGTCQSRASLGRPPGNVGAPTAGIYGHAERGRPRGIRIGHSTIRPSVQSKAIHPRCETPNISDAGQAASIPTVGVTFLKSALCGVNTGPDTLRQASSLYLERSADPQTYDHPVRPGLPRN